MISFLAIFAYLPRADDPAIVAPPGVDHEVIVVVYVPKRANPNLAVVTPPVLGFDDGIFEDQGGIPEIDAVLVEISLPLFLVPFEADGLRYTFVDTLVKLPIAGGSTLLVSYESENTMPRRSGTINV